MPGFTAVGAAAELFRSKDREILCDSGAGTGKSFSLMWHARMTAEKYPDCSLIFAMATRKALSDTVLPEFEREVLGTDHHAIHGTASLEHRYDYRFSNGAKILLVGLDSKSAERKLSAKYDKVYVFQAEQVKLAAIAKLQSRLRGFRTDAHQVLMDCNPAHAFHWLNVRAEMWRCLDNDPALALHPDPTKRKHGCTWFGEMPKERACPKCGSGLAKLMKRIHYRHHDNPLLWDWEKGEWTLEGLDYMATLNQLTGVDRERLLFHRWVSNTGLVVPQYDPFRHRLDPEIVRAIRMDYYVGGLDWGQRVPGTFQVWGYSKAYGAIYLVAEVYRVGWSYSQWADAIEELVKEYDEDPVLGRKGLFAGIVADSADPIGGIPDLNRRLLRYQNHPTRAFVSGADKRRGPGINAVREGFQGDSIFLAEDSLRMGVDPALRVSDKATCLHEELISLSWRDPNENQPEKEEFDPLQADHGFDALRYVKMLVDSGDLTPPYEPWQPPPGTIGHALRWTEALQHQA